VNAPFEGLPPQSEAQPLLTAAETRTAEVEAERRRPVRRKAEVADPGDHRSEHEKIEHEGEGDDAPRTRGGRGRDTRGQGVQFRAEARE